MKRFLGKIAVVTGAASGIGRACAVRLASEGARLVLVDRDPVQIDPMMTVEDVLVRRMDVSRPAAWAELCEAIRASFGRVDILVNSAGIVRSGPDQAVSTATLESIHDVMGVNLDGAWLAIRTLLPLFGTGAAIVNVASRAALVGTPHAVAYAASKAALVSLTKSVALSMSRNTPQIRCNAVLPGSIDTPMWRPLGTGGAALDRAAVLAGGLPHIPMGRLGTPEEVAGSILFLASDDASYVTGSVLSVDGGQAAT